MLRIGLTGGIASGKSTVASFFAERDIDVIDTDAIARELVAPGTPALAAIVDRFGPEILAGPDELDRRKLREIVFHDTEARRDLEAILHPAIRAETLARADSSQSPYVVIAVPLLFEAGFDQLVDRCLVVDCPVAIQIERVMTRDKVSAADARAIIESQLDRAQRNAGADDLIDNSGTLAETLRQAGALHERYLEISRNC